VQTDRFADIAGKFVKSGGLRDYRKIEAFGNELAFAAADAHLQIENGRPGAP
jgi:hypothetical protein